MLSDLHVGQFRAFGFTVLKNCLTAAEMKRLEAAYERVIADAPSYQYFGDCGTKMLCSFVDCDDAFGALIEHPAIMQAMRDIWGTECLYAGGSDMWSNLDDTPWHSDGQPGRESQTLKTAIYLDPTSDDQGPLNVVPGSHHSQFCAAIFQSCGTWDRGRPRLRLDRDKVPGAISLCTQPGDVVLWDNRLWHSAWKRKDGKPRRTMFITYVPDPLDNLVAQEQLRAGIKQTLGSGRTALYTKEMMGKGGAAREKMAARLEALGVEGVRE